MSPVCAHQQPQGREEILTSPGWWRLNSFSAFAMKNQEPWGLCCMPWDGSRCQQGSVVAYSKCSGGQGRAAGWRARAGFQQRVPGHSLLEQPLRKVQGTLTLPRPDFPPFAPKNPKLDQCKLVLPECDIRCFLNTYALDTGIRCRGKYVVRKARCVVMSRVVWRSVERQCRCQPLPVCLK